MVTKQNDHLFELIKSLSKSEKRAFKLFVNRIQGKETAKFIQLFDALDKMSGYNELVIHKKVPELKKNQLSNTKAHLYKQILTALRLVSIQKNLDIQLREQLDYALIMFNKGLYNQSLRILQKARQIAENEERYLLLLEIVEFEKQIEIHHTNKRMEERAEFLIKKTETAHQRVHLAGQLSNLVLKLNGLYIKLGHVRNEKDAFFLKEFFQANFPKLPSQLSFSEKYFLYQSYVWYYNIQQDFLHSYRFAQKWVDLFEEKPEMKNSGHLYLQCLTNLLTALFNINHYKKYTEVFEQLQTFLAESSSSFDQNEQVLALANEYTAKINLHFMRGDFTGGVRLLPQLKVMLKDNDIYLDQNKIIVFYYKMACMYFGSGNYPDTVDCLNFIIQMKAGNMREDIQCFARLLHLIVHYEMGNFTLLEYLAKSVFRFLVKLEDLNQVQKEILKFLRTILYAPAEKYRQEFIKLKLRLQVYENDPFEKRSFLYLDIISWLESKIQKEPVQDVIQRKFTAKRTR